MIRISLITPKKITMIDLWNPSTFPPEVTDELTRNSDIIHEYYNEQNRIINDKINGISDYNLSPSRLTYAFHNLREHIITPLIHNHRIRIWHYTRLFDHEINEMMINITPSSLSFLKQRLDTLVNMRLLSEKESAIIFKSSPFHTQEKIRSNMLWGVTVPLPSNDSGVQPFLNNWGGESAYFWLSEPSLAKKIASFGTPRIIEIETAITDRSNSFCASETVLDAWARHLGIKIKLSSLCKDIAITNCIKTATVVTVHSQHDSNYIEIAEFYPEAIKNLKGESSL